MKYFPIMRGGCAVQIAVDISRMMDRIETLSGFNSTPGKGVTRFSYSPEDRKAREYLGTISPPWG